MAMYDDFGGSKKFDHFIPNLLKDAEIQTILREEFQLSKGDTQKLHNDLRDEVHGFLHDYILEHAPQIDGVEVNINEDPEEMDYGIYTYLIRGMKGVFFTESADDDTCFFSDFKTARESIELNHNVVLDDFVPDEDSKVNKSLGNRISEAEQIIFDDHLFGRKKY